MPEIAFSILNRIKLLLAVVALGAAGLLAGQGQAQEGEGQPLPAYYPLQGIAVQYESKNCGYRTVVIQVQLELESIDQMERVTAFGPRLQADLYAAVASYIAKNKKIEDRKVKGIFKSTANRTLGRGYVKDVLIMNILHQG